MSPTETAALIGQTLSGYRITAALGSGDSTSVFRATDETLEREVVLKIIPPARAGEPGVTPRFRAEARRAAALLHHNLVPLYQIGEDRGNLFVAMPLYPESLHERLTREGRLPPADVAAIGAQLAEGLDALHRGGLIHGSVRPEHILLADDGTPLLSAFGVTRQNLIPASAPLEDVPTQPRLDPSARQYASPEQFSNGEIDARSDVYSLGAVLYEALTGAPPHELPPNLVLAERLFEEPVAAPSAVNAAVPPALDAAVLRALAYNPADRFPDARSFAEALDPELDIAQQPTLTRVPVREITATATDTTPSLSLPHWPWRFDGGPEGTSRSRRWALLAAACLLLVSLMGGAAFFLHNSSADASQNTPAVSTDTPTYAPATDTAVPTATATSRPTATATTRALPTNTPKPTATATSTPAVVITVIPNSLDAGACGSGSGNITLTTTSLTAVNWTAATTSSYSLTPPNGTVVSGPGTTIVVGNVTTTNKNGTVTFTTTSPNTTFTPSSVTVTCS